MKIEIPPAQLEAIRELTDDCEKRLSARFLQGSGH